MELSDRKKKILKIVVDDYIQSAVPVSSKLITDKYLTNVSSATVRSELAQLEELGFLTQPHTSSGRIPSSMAYKLYVTDLIEKEDGVKLTSNELDYIEKVFTEKSGNMEKILRMAVDVISNLTSLTSVGITSHEGTEKLLNAKLVRLLPEKALLIIVTDSKIFKDGIIEIPSNISDDQIEEVNTILQGFCGKTIKEFCDMEKAFSDGFSEFKEIFLNVIGALRDYLENSDEVITAGEDKICSHPEYADASKIKNFLSVVTDKDKVINIMSGVDRNIKVNIKLGSDGYSEIPEDCSLVTATYYVKGVKIGSYGVIGPNRMDYQKVVAVLENVGRILENILNQR